MHRGKIKIESMFWMKTCRRLISNKLISCRRYSTAILVIWVLIIIVLIYKITNNDIQPNQGIGLPVSDRFQASDLKFVEHVQDSLSKGGNDYDGDEKQTQTDQHVISEESDKFKWDTKDYVRKGKVFILLIEDERTQYRKKSMYMQNRSGHDRTRQVKPDLDSDLPNPDWDIHLPDHIALVINILESHRISYTLGSTRNGLPSSLLADTNDTSSNKDPQYPVIIMDDFMKYTQLNRWIRDQIDRHCRKNHIGIITYLRAPSSMINETLLSEHSSSPAPTDTKKSDGNPNVDRMESQLADHFPLSFKTINQNSCKSNPKVRSHSYTPGASHAPPSCLVDYQLNDKSPILRTLKRRSDFILPGPLMLNLNRSPWISILTNHVTYEPLTWAKLVHPQNNNNISIDNTQFANNRTITGGSINQHQSQNLDNNNGHNNSLKHRRHARASLDLDLDPKRPKLDANVQSQPNLMLIESKLNVSNERMPAEGAALNSSDINESDDMSMPDMVEDGPPDEIDHSALIHDLINDDSEQTIDSDGNVIEKQRQLYSDPESADCQTLSLYDRGLFDGIRRVIFGGANHHWINRILLLDAIEHLSDGRILTPLNRFIQIDIDDVFVGERGTKLTRADVDALVATQAEFSKRVPNFKFNLGYSGAFYERGLSSEKEGDRHLVASASNFSWFCHTWSHKKAHLFNDSKSIETELVKNLEFARKHRLPLIGGEIDAGRDDGSANETLEPTDQNEAGSLARKMPASYAIAPHHSGVYPIHEQLYAAWKRVLNVQVTSTEEYPHLRPESARRAFVHKTIKVLPRQTCGLYTHTIRKSKYPGGFGRLLSSCQGGELFESLLHNQINIYMTHQSNYANDRLAPLTFGLLLDFVRNFTNLQVNFAPSTKSGGPGALQLAAHYFSLYPAEKQEPLWTNPCSDPRHLAIWAPPKHNLCRYAPGLIIVGPQKSGTTALFEFLQMSKSVRASRKSATDFEEVQFFNAKHYWRGVDWYFERFKQSSSSNETSEELDGQLDDKHRRARNTQASSTTLFVDKSATYFDDPKAPQRAHALLPNAKVVIILINPADRAYSWYQHQRSHSDPVATQFSFEQIIQSTTKPTHDNETDAQGDTPGTLNSLRQLRARCLMPGFYSSHLSRWLEFYSSRQIIIIDGQWFRANPASVMSRLQVLLRLESQVDYRSQLIYEPRKGFYCKLVESSASSRSQRPHCLGPGKGRRYEPMSADARLYLNRLYYGHNRQLARILNDIGQPLPDWLQEAITSSSVSYSYLRK